LAAIGIMLGEIHERLFFYKESQRRRVSVKKVFLGHRPDLAIAKETCQAKRPEPLLDHVCIMIRLAKETLAPAIATTKTTAIDR